MKVSSESPNGIQLSFLHWNDDSYKNSKRHLLFDIYSPSQCQLELNAENQSPVKENVVLQTAISEEYGLNDESQEIYNLINFQKSNNKRQFQDYKSIQIQFKPEALWEKQKHRAKQTENLGKHLKSITLAYLSVIANSKMTSKADQAAIAQSRNNNGGIQTFRELFQHQQLRNGCMEFYFSNFFVSIIPRSPKMLLKNKISMIMHLKKFQKMAKLRNLKNSPK